MRELNTFQSYLDEIGRPLVGRVRFCGADGTTPSNVYDKDGKSLDNVMLTDNAGRLKKQVFLDDHDYTLFFEKYIGAGTMREDADADAWKPIGSSVNTYDTFNIKVDAKGIQCVKNIAELMSLDPTLIAETGGERVVGLLGYFDAGDKPVVYYRFDPGISRYLVDGGKYIASNKTVGAWVLIDGPGGVDVRDFGAFPNDAAVRNDYQKYRIQSAMQYANRLGKDLLFTSNGAFCYYDVSSLVSLNRVVCDEEALLYCCRDFKSYAYDVKSISVYADNDLVDGEFNVYGTDLRTSMNRCDKLSVKLHPSKRIVIDKDIYCEFNDVDVVIDVNQTQGCKFTRCRFSGDLKIGGSKYNNKFISCEIYGSMLDLSSSSTFSFISCNSSCTKWDDVDDYVDFCTLNLSYEIDCNQSILQREHTISHNCRIENVISENKFVIEKAMYVVLENCTLSNLFIFEGASIYAEHCLFGIKNTAYFISLDCDDCTFIGCDKQNENPIICGSIRNCTVETSLNTIAHTKFDSCTFTVDIALIDSKVTDSLVSDVLFDRCTFSENVSPKISYSYNIENKRFDIMNIYKVDKIVIKNCTYQGDSVRKPVVIKDNNISMNPTQGRYVITNNIGSSYDSERMEVILDQVRWSRDYDQSSSDFERFISRKRKIVPTAEADHPYFYGYGFDKKSIFNLFGERTNENISDEDYVHLHASFVFFDPTYGYSTVITWDRSCIYSDVDANSFMEFASARYTLTTDDPLGCRGKMYISMTRLPNK